MAFDVKISGFADEIDSMVDKQFEHLKKLGIFYFEPRGIDGTNIADLSDVQVKELKNKMDANGIRVSSVGSPLGKILITDEFAPHLEKTKRVAEIAKTLDTKYVRVFSFFMPEGDDPSKYRGEVMERLGKMVEEAEKADLIFLHENEKEIYGDIAPRCKDIFDSISSKALGCVFDPANFVQCGQKVFPDAYELLRPHITYMHIKDAKADGTVVPAGFGEGGLKRLIAALKESGYQGFLSLEPHLGSFAGLADLELSEEMLKLEESGPEKFTMAYQALMDILKEVKG